MWDAAVKAVFSLMAFDSYTRYRYHLCPFSFHRSFFILPHSCRTTPEGVRAFEVATNKAIPTSTAASVRRMTSVRNLQNSLPSSSGGQSSQMTTVDKNVPIDLNACRPEMWQQADKEGYLFKKGTPSGMFVCHHYWILSNDAQGM